MKKFARSVVLFSGGIDSTTALYWAREESERPHALSIIYGQRHTLEVRLSKKIAAGLGIPQKILKVDLAGLGGSSLTDPSIPLPRFSAAEEIPEGVPSTYVPFRNGIFLSLAAAWAEVIGARAVICGFNVLDSPNYPDTRVSFVQAMQKAVNLGTRASHTDKKVEILAPFIDLTKSQIIQKGLEMGADYSFSVSCYSGEEIPCGRCSSCLLRSRAWAQAGEQDHLLRRLVMEGRYELDTQG